jgi:MFS superfamily sulfate permease-like transporter
MWKISRQDTSVAIMTGLLTFFTSSQIGIVVGIVLSFISTLFRLSKPHWAILGEVNEGGRDYDQELLMSRLNIGDQPPPTPADIVEAQNGEASSSGGDEGVPLIPPVRVYRDLKRYVDAKEHQSILIFRFDGSIYFLVIYFRSLI